MSATLAIACAVVFWAFVGMATWSEYRADRSAGRKFHWPEPWEW